MINDKETIDIILSGIDGHTILWDFDGVIADTEPLHAESYRYILTRLGARPSQTFFSRYIGNTEKEIWNSLKCDGLLPGNPDISELIEERSRIFLELAKQLKPSKTAALLIDAFAEKTLSQFVLSNGEPKNIMTLLHHWGLDSLLKIGRDPHISKIDALRIFWSNHQTCTIEDNANYLKKAHEAGSMTVGILHSMNPEAVGIADYELMV